MTTPAWSGTAASADFELVDQLVLRGHLMPFVPGWWELIRWRQVERIAAPLRER